MHSATCGTAKSVNTSSARVKRSPLQLGYLIDVKQSKATWSWINALAQIVVSGFTGVIGGLISIESGFSIYMILATAGISGAMGSVALTYFWERLTGVKNAKS